ncbi:MAG: hypothetical protein WA108_02630 [Thiobacillus sp.]
MSLWDSVFGKKAANSVSNVIEVHILDPKGSYTTHWKVGEEVPTDVVERFKNPSTNQLYAVTVYEAGEPTTSVLSYALWLEFKLAMEE